MTDDERFEEDIAALRRIYEASKSRVGLPYCGISVSRDSDDDRVTTVEFGDDVAFGSNPGDAIIGVSEMYAPPLGASPVYAVEEFVDGEIIGTTTDCLLLDEALVEFEAREYIEADVTESDGAAQDWN